MYSFPDLEPVCCSMYHVIVLAKVKEVQEAKVDVVPQTSSFNLFSNCSNCCILTCIQISQEAGKVVLYSHLFKNFPQLVIIHTVKDFSVLNEANGFLALSCLFNLYAEYIMRNAGLDEAQAGIKIAG